MSEIVADERAAIGTRPQREWESGALYRKVVIPTDNSELCHAGLDWGIEFAHVYAARLHDDRLNLFLWHVPALYQAALRNELIHSWYNPDVEQV